MIPGAANPMLLRRAPASEGPELVPDTGFDNPSLWTRQTAWSVSGSKAIYTTPGGGVEYIQPSVAINLVTGKTYRVVFGFVDVAGTATYGLFNISTSQNLLSGYQNVSANGDVTFTFSVTSNTTGVRVYGNGLGSSFALSRLSIKEVL